MAALIARSPDLLGEISASRILHDDIELAAGSSVHLLKAHNIGVV